jgi:hypothetical protein
VCVLRLYKTFCLRRNTVEVTDIQGTTHELQYQVLGTEDKLNTPSLILVKDTANDGVAVFSQVNDSFKVESD